jgi:hypothetical protein
MKTIVIHEFTRHFTRYRRQPCLVKDRHDVVGQWVPVATEPEPIDVMKRLKSDCKSKLPFTGAQLLKESRDR